LSQNTGSSVYAITPSTTDCANASPPVINGVAATGITTNGATIAWTTNIPAESTVSYGTTTSYGATSTNPTLVTAHSVSLSNLNAGTLYHYAIASSDYGTSTTSGDNTFATATLTSAGASSVNVGGGGSAYDASINGGAATTPTPSVTLSLYGTEAYTMEVSNTSTFAGATWIPYATALPWTLAPGLGTETVYAQFRSVAGTILGTAQASIDLVSAGTMGSATSSSPSSATVPASPSSAASLTAELASLQAKLAALLKQAGQASTATAPASIHFVFTRNLSLGMTSNDVKQLQAFLAKNPVLYPQDKVTGYFGTLTLKAVQRFQAKYGIAKAGQSVYGYVGPATRAMLNSLIEKGLSP
jgi:hypothetical protein